MSAKLEEIEGIFRGERHRFGDCLIGSLDMGDGSDWLTIKGDADEEELHRGQRYRFYGKFANYRNRRSGSDERQFHFQTFVLSRPHNKEGIVEYLARAGKGLGLGRGTAEKLWAVHGPDTIRRVRERPGRISQANPRITAEQAEAIGQILRFQQATEDATIEVTELLTGRGLPKTTARKAIKLWGNRAAQAIKRDPYSLMAFRGCGFKLCDALWIELGHSPHRLRRQALCAWHSVASDSNGHVWFPAQAVAQSVRQAIGGTEAQPVRAIKLATRLAKWSPNHYGALAAVRADRGVIVEAGGDLWLAEGRKADAERDLARMLAAAVAEQHCDGSIWPDATAISGIDDHQREHLARALTSRVAILGGSPGTGKTYATAMLIRHLLNSGIVGQQDIAIGCPTGKAAVRITEAMQAAGVPLVARTWHSLLGVGAADDESGDWGFLHGKASPWPFRILIGDESSMLDASLMRSIFAARARGCHVLLVGDINQLPPVGAGAPLRDMIASRCFGYGALTEIKRNSGGIVEACAAIRDGKQWGPGENLIIKEVATARQLDCVLDTIHEAAGDGFDPVWDCQVLVAVNARSPLSRKAVNQHLQAELNSNPAIKGTPFRIDDKIVCLKNGKFPLIHGDAEAAEGENGNFEAYVANGELARVIEVAEKYLVAELTSPNRTIRIPRGKAAESDGDSEESGAGCSWDLAYGLSTHKSQGSEFPVTIVIIDEYPGAKLVCSREWIFTAISRGKAKTVLVGKKSTADSMCRRVAIGHRKTFLRELIQMETTNLAIEGI